MLTLKLEFLNNPVAMAAIRKLANTDKLDAPMAYRVGRIAARVDREMETVRPSCVAVLKKYTVKDEKGEVKGWPGGPFEFAPGDEAKHDEEMKALMKEEFSEKVHKVPLSCLTKVGLTPIEVIALEPILEVDLPEFQEPKLPNSEPQPS